MSENYLLSLICLTALLVLNALLQTFGGLFLNLVTVVILTRVVFPKYRKSIFYRMLVLFDLTTFAQTIRKKMIHVGGARQAAIVVGTTLHFLMIYGTMILITSGIYVMNFDSGIVTYIPAMHDKITIASMIFLGALSVLFLTSWIFIGFGYYSKFSTWKSIRELARMFHPEHGQVGRMETPNPWHYMTRAQKFRYAAIDLVLVSFMMDEFYALGFIMSPAQTFGTTLEPKFVALVLGTFGTWDNALLAEIGVLGSIGLTMWILMRLNRRMDRQAISNSSLQILFQDE